MIAIFIIIIVMAALITLAWWKGDVEWGVITTVLVLILGGAFLLSFGRAHYNERDTLCTVTDKDRGQNQGGYRIYTEQCGVLEDTDSLWRGKFNSADVWQQIQPGHAYQMKIVGWRFGFLSHFPNILEVQEAP
jgi:hypothetical protein